MNRRSLLKAAAAAPLAAVPAVAVAEDVCSTDTPIPVLFREWESACAVEHAAYEADLTDSECARLARVRGDIELRMDALPCENAADFIRKIATHTCFGVFAMEDHEKAPALWAEARALIA